MEGNYMLSLHYDLDNEKVKYLISTDEKVGKLIRYINKTELILEEDGFKCIVKLSLIHILEIKPYNKKGKTPCEYCEYKAICGFNPQNKDNNYNYVPQNVSMGTFLNATCMKEENSGFIKWKWDVYKRQKQHKIYVDVYMNFCKNKILKRKLSKR